METYLTQITNYLLTQSWQIAVLVALIAAANFALRNKSAHVRYLLWLIVLAKCLTPPLLEVPVAVLPERTPAPAVTMVAPIPTIAEAPPITPRPAKPAPIVAPVVSSRPQLSPRQWVAIGWLVGAAAFACIAAAKAYRTVRWLHRDRRPLPADMQKGVNDLLSSLKLRRLPRMWLLEGIGQPFVWGAMRGDIYLPASFVRIPDDEHRRHVLGHEISHVMRFDAAVNLIQTIAQAILWFHPFVWWANKKIRAEREKCCDEMAIARLDARAKDYSKAIVETLVTEYESTRPVPSLAIAGPVKNIEERIRTMMRPGRKFYKRPSLIAAIVVMLIALLTVPTALVLTARAVEEAAIASETKPTKSLHEAAADGDFDQVKLHISNSVDVNSKDKRGRAALHRAAYPGHTEVARLLIEHGADVNVEDKLKRTPLEHAAVASRTQVVRLLIEKGANVNARNKRGATPLHVAANSADKDTVEVLIDKGANVTLGDTGGSTPLYWAMMSSNLNRREIVEIIVATGKVPSTIYLAAYIGDSAKVKTFIEEGVAVNEKGAGAVTALHCAAAGGHKEVAQLLLARGADVTVKASDGMTPLHAGVYCSDGLETVKLLIANGADVNDHASVEDEMGMSVLGLRFVRCVSHSTELADAGRKEMYARVKSLWNSEITRLLISEGARFGDGDKMWLSIAEKMDIPEIKELAPANSDDENKEQSKDSGTLHQAAADGDIEQVKSFISKSAGVNGRNEDARTPLIVAADEGHKDVVELLLSKGAEVEARDEDDYTALHHAAIDGHLDVVKTLLEHGADVNAWKGDRSWAAIHVAIQHGYYDIVKLLVDKGADINAKCSTSGTPLETVVHFGTEQHMQIAQLLSKKGAVSRSRILTDCYLGDVNSVKELIGAGTDVNKKGFASLMPLHCAANSGQIAVAELLLAKGASVNAKDGWNATPLHRASGKDQLEMAALLIAKGADLNAKDRDGDTPLHCASLGWGNAHFPGSLEAVKLLLEEGAEIDVCSKSGETPLHRASVSGFKGVVQELLKKGADLNIRNNQGLTALGLAKQENHTEVIELLRKHGAKE